ncbi:hemin ABC transporter substrate-binding protein (plasmid) [Falsihalocynthiibacter sp. SS001]|uniref:heme/hemin ABC transporter substrate-binding protein n=1 Tax=Falsihalocynthiibacter sp. SS001 TaxID=3349698 RepID=UPI0036D28B89
MRFLAPIFALILPSLASAQSFPDAKAIVSIGGPVTEVVYALGQESRIVARDTTSVFPPQTADLPDVGYMRQLSAEGVLSVGPDLILTRDTAGPPEVLDQLRGAAVPIVEVVDAFSPEAVINAVNTIGTALDVPAEAEALATRIQQEFDTLAEKQAQAPVNTRVLFVLSNKGGRLTVAGRDTGANGIIKLAGGTNAMEDAFSGYKIMNDEALISAAPDVILMMPPTGDHTGDISDVLTLPAISQTPAGQNDALVMVDPAALGFGPRTGQFATQLYADLRAITAKD